MAGDYRVDRALMSRMGSKTGLVSIRSSNSHSEVPHATHCGQLRDYPPQTLYDSLCSWLENRGEERPHSQKLALSEMKRFIDLPNQSPKKISGQLRKVYAGVSFTPPD